MSVHACPSCFPALTPGQETITVHINMPVLARAIVIVENTFATHNEDVDVLVVVKHAEGCRTAAVYRMELFQKALRREKPKAP